MLADGEANALQPWWQSFASSWFLLGRTQVMILCAFTSKPHRRLWLSQMTLQMMRKRFNEWDGGDRGVGRRQTTREHCFCSATAYCLVCNYHYKGVCAQAPPRSSFVHISAFHSSFALFGCCRAVLTPSVATGRGCVCARFPSAFIGALPSSREACTMRYMWVDQAFGNTVRQGRVRSQGGCEVKPRSLSQFD